MKISDLNVGDLLRFTCDTDGLGPPDLGIVVKVVKLGLPQVVVHWNYEEDNPCLHDDSEMNEWLTCGFVEVVSEKISAVPRGCSSSLKDNAG